MNTDAHRWGNGMTDPARSTTQSLIRVHPRSSVAKVLRCGVLALVAACVLPACNALPTGLADKSVGPYDRPFPVELAQTETLDIQVIRRPETRITMTNTTARSFGPSTVWLNGRFNRPIDGFRAGQTLTLDLYDFRDEFGETFRAGGFFATKAPEKIMHAQLETLVEGDSRMIGLVMVDQDDIR